MRHVAGEGEDGEDGDMDGDEAGGPEAAARAEALQSLLRTLGVELSRNNQARMSTGGRSMLLYIYIYIHPSVYVYANEFCS